MALRQAQPKPRPWSSGVNINGLAPPGEYGYNSYLNDDDSSPKSNAPPHNNAPRNNAPRKNAPRNNAPRNNAPRKNAPRNNAPRNNAPRNNAPRNNAPRNNAPRKNAPRNNAPRNNAPRNNKPQDAQTDRTEVQEQRHTRRQPRSSQQPRRRQTTVSSCPSPTPKNNSVQSVSRVAVHAKPKPTHISRHISASNPEQIRALDDPNTSGLDTSKPYVVSVMAPWCRFCQDFKPQWDMFVRSCEKKGIQVVVIDYDALPSARAQNNSAVLKKLEKYGKITSVPSVSLVNPSKGRTANHANDVVRYEAPAHPNNVYRSREDLDAFYAKNAASNNAAQRPHTGRGRAPSSGAPFSCPSLREDDPRGSSRARASSPRARTTRVTRSVRSSPSRCQRPANVSPLF